jgi:hypothetical protein
MPLLLLCAKSIRISSVPAVLLLWMRLLQLLCQAVHLTAQLLHKPKL